jgi:hypothetical protein
MKETDCLLGEVSKEDAETEFQTTWTQEQWDEIRMETYEEFNCDFHETIMEAVRETATNLGYIIEE